MEHLPSPDLPAWFCYLLVLGLGMLGARSTVNRLLADQPGHWNFTNTWLLFWAHAAVPAGLLWFLDYVSALRDSSLFGALLVALGYRQILAGGVQGITLTGQTSRLWQPFEAWVSAIKDQIATDYKNARDLFDTKVRTFLADDDARLEKLRDLTFAYTSDPTALAAQLTALGSRSAPAGTPPQSFLRWKNIEQARILLNELRKSQPVNYGLFLKQNRLVTTWMYRNWVQSQQSRLIGWVVTSLIAFTMVSLGWACYHNKRVALWYYEWRLTKTDSSDRERFRSHDYLLQRLKTAAQSKSSSDEEILSVVSPLVSHLRFDGTSTRTADDILTLLVDAHSVRVDEIVFPKLIEALRTPNEDLRLRIRWVLSGLQRTDYPGVAPSKLADSWVPSKGESAVEIDRHVQEWQAWWRSANPKAQVQTVKPADSTLEEAPAGVGSRAGSPEIYPDPTMTPGAASPDINQANIASNICNKKWSTSEVRPSSSVTNRIKEQTMKLYGFTDSRTHYELDHLISLQVGGCPDCITNLWPEAYGDRRHPMTQGDRAAWNRAHPGSEELSPGALEKDLVENHIHDEVCLDIPDARMSSLQKKFPPTVSITLQRGQEILAWDWYACYLNLLNQNRPCR